MILSAMILSWLNFHGQLKKFLFDDFRSEQLTILIIFGGLCR